jgi:hypothetical protein
VLFTFLEDVFLEVVVAEDFNVFVEAEDEASDAEVTDDFCLEEPVVWAVGCLSLLYRVTASTSIATRPLNKFMALAALSGDCVDLYRDSAI